MSAVNTISPNTGVAGVMHLYGYKRMIGNE